MWEQQERESALETQISGLERALAESQAGVARQNNLRWKLGKCYQIVGGGPKKSS